MIWRLSRGAVRGVGVLCVVLGAAGSPVFGQDEHFVRGEVNQDGSIDVSDAVSILFHLPAFLTRGRGRAAGRDRG